MAQDQKPPFWSTKEFEAERSKWEKRLEESGFEDAERFVTGEYLLKQFHQGVFKRAHEENPHGVENKAEYYRLAGQFLHSHKFDSKKEALIWQLHAEGLPRRVILQKLKSARMKSTEATLKEVIYRLADLMRSQITNPGEYDE